MTCTLGEVKNRADFIIYWGGNPAECHPRHFTKYTLTQKGKFVPNGRKDRTMVLVDIRETPSAKAADIFLQIKPTKDFEVLTILRALLKNQPVDRELAAETGLTLEQLQDLVDRMKAARFGVIFFGMGISMTRGKHMNSAALLTLAAEMNAFTKFVAMPMRGHGNVTGADVVMRWTTGYPFGVNLSSRLSALQPGRVFDGGPAGSRRRGRGAHPRRRSGATMPQPAIDHLGRIPTIVLDPKVTHTSRLARVHITTAVTGISATGTVYRMDEIPLPLRPALKSPYPTDEEVIRRISQAVAAKRPLVPPLVPGLSALSIAHHRANEERQLVGNSMLRITGGKVYDPAKRRQRSSRMLHLDGHIVAAVDGGRTINATGMVIFPGGVDVHTHVAGCRSQFRSRDDAGRSSQSTILFCTRL